ncbi:MAG: FHA domain-containing protein [Phycisphaerae bacterium]
MDVRLVMFRNDGKRKDFPLTGASTVIGRGESCDLRVPLLSVSRRHCEVSVDGDEVMVRDLGSSNGTFVNNKKIGEQEMCAGDRLVVGPVVFTLQVNGEPEEIQPVKTKGQKLTESSLGGEATVNSDKSRDDTGIPIGAPPVVDEDEDPIAALEDMVAQTLREEDENDKSASTGM